jgi:hypothetical protein
MTRAVKFIKAASMRAESDVHEREDKNLRYMRATAKQQSLQPPAKQRVNRMSKLPGTTKIGNGRYTSGLRENIVGAHERI